MSPGCVRTLNPHPPAGPPVTVGSSGSPARRIGTKRFEEKPTRCAKPSPAPQAWVRPARAAQAGTLQAAPRRTVGDVLRRPAGVLQDGVHGAVEREAVQRRLGGGERLRLGCGVGFEVVAERGVVNSACAVVGQAQRAPARAPQNRHAPTGRRSATRATESTSARIRGKGARAPLRRLQGALRVAVVTASSALRCIWRE